MKSNDRKRLAAFVEARTDELVDPRLRESHRALLALTGQQREAAAEDADWGWAETVFGGPDLGDAIFGDDPETQAEELTVAIHRALALAHAGHPEYDPAWQPRRRR